MLVSMSDESDSKTYEERAWQYFLQLQPSIADVNAAAELAFRAVEAFDKGLKRRRTQKCVRRLKSFPPQECCLGTEVRTSEPGMARFTGLRREPSPYREL